MAQQTKTNLSDLFEAGQFYKSSKNHTMGLLYMILSKGEDECMVQAYKDGEPLDTYEGISYEDLIPHLAFLPTDKEVEDWFEEHIDDKCSASSAIYLFRLWLRERAVGESQHDLMKQKQVDK